MQRASIRYARCHLRAETLEGRRMLAGDLRIAELNYHPHPAMVQFGERDADADDFEFVEVINVGETPINLNGYRLTQGIRFRFDQQLLSPQGRLVVTKDLRDFRSRYGDRVNVALGDDGNGGDPGEFDGSLNNGGEQIVLQDPSGQVIQNFNYFDVGEWPRLADGQGASLEIIDPKADPNDPKNWQASARYGGTPGEDEAAAVSPIVINELLTHTDLPQIDTIELHNRSDDAVDMTGWYLTDSFSDIFRYQFSGAKAMLRANDYLVLDATELGFSFRGQEADDAFLIEADAAGRPVRFADAVRFSATQNGVSLGRWEDGHGELFPMVELSFGAPNTGPQIGQVVISEIHYHPPTDSSVSELPADDREFIELLNRTGNPLDISQWRLREAVDFTIPNRTIIGAGETIVVVGFDPQTNPDRADDFRRLYGMGPNAVLMGPYSDASDPNSDQLDDDGERLIWERPEDLQQLGLGYVLVDRVHYRDTGDWPTEADGQGRSLTRQNATDYGDFGASWSAAVPTAGSTRAGGDLNEDGLMDARDLDAMCAAISLGGSNARFDLDRNARIDSADFLFAVSHLFETSLCDANLDGRFDSSDLVLVFAAGQYEDARRGNSTWATGDWNCDREFDTSDLVAAFQAGGYQS